MARAPSEEVERRQARATALVNEALTSTTLDTSKLLEDYTACIDEVLKRTGARARERIIPTLLNPRLRHEVRVNRLGCAFGLAPSHGVFVELARIEHLAANGSTLQRQRARTALALSGQGRAWLDSSKAERAALLLTALVAWRHAGTR